MVILRYSLQITLHSSDPRSELDVGGASAHLPGGVPVSQHPARRRSRGDRAVPASRAHGTHVSNTNTHTYTKIGSKDH